MARLQEEFSHAAVAFTGEIPDEGERTDEAEPEEEVTSKQMRQWMELAEVGERLAGRRSDAIEQRRGRGRRTLNSRPA